MINEYEFFIDLEQYGKMKWLVDNSLENVFYNAIQKSLNRHVRDASLHTELVLLPSTGSRILESHFRKFTITCVSEEDIFLLRLMGALPPKYPSRQDVGDIMDEYFRGIGV